MPGDNDEPTDLAEPDSMTRQDVIDFCLTFPQAYEDYPFAEFVGDRSWAVMRHQSNKKSFAFIFEHKRRLCVNLKCEPLEADALRGVFKDVAPGYHMNKTHWNSVYVGGDVPDEVLCDMIAASYDLIKPKVHQMMN